MYKILNILLIVMSVALSNDKEIYSTVQMLDQIQIINPNDMQIQQTIMTEFSSMNQNLHSNYEVYYVYI